ncbi:hypothetical protein N7493_010487 [Penicillium malachiteum]|uniref:Uncharacterized protein n=1 Tax=Penicillium malachiteum TaxID=1324776 RepID=A0AAD6HD42_9EURO|nr:hypothetical protein N7493_010487 [Penicillium malachiteum]
MCFASFQTTTGRSASPREPVREMDHGFPSFQASPGRLGAPDRACPETDHSFPSFQAIPGGLGAPDRACPETGHSFPSFQAISGSSASLERALRKVDHGFRCKSTTNQYIEHRRRVLALLVNRLDRLSSEEMPSSCDNLRFVDPTHRSHFLSNSVTNRRRSIPVFLGSEITRTSSSKAANTLAGALRPWGRFKAPVQPRWSRSEV